MKRLLSKMSHWLKTTLSTSKKTLAKLWTATAALFLFTLPSVALAAGDIGSSELAKGTEKLLKDATTWLMIIVPLVTVLVVIYYLIRRAAADEMDHKKWNSRITTAIISCIIAVAASALLNMLTAYFASGG